MGLYNYKYRVVIDPSSGVVSLVAGERHYDGNPDGTAPLLDDNIIPIDYSTTDTYQLSIWPYNQSDPNQKPRWDSAAFWAPAIETSPSTNFAMARARPQSSGSTIFVVKDGGGVEILNFKYQSINPNPGGYLTLDITNHIGSNNDTLIIGMRLVVINHKNIFYCSEDPQIRNLKEGAS